MYRNISVVYSSHLGEAEDHKFEKMLRKTSGLPDDQFDILRYENHNQYSLTELYNRGLKESKHRIVLFIHNDTRFVKDGWGPVLLEKFNTGDFGIIGLAGTNRILREHQGQWFKYAGYNAGFVYHPDESGGMEETWLCNKLTFIVPAVAVDGVFMAIAKDRIVLGFDEDFNGFHFYDISFCIRNFEKRVKVGIIADLSIVLYHNSKGRYNKEWNKNRLKFLDKYRDSYIAPIILDVPEFIILNKHNRISDLLIEYDSFGGLSLNWKLYNAGGHVTTPAQPVMEAYKEYLPLTSAVNKHVKTILQPRYTLTIGNSHQAMYIDGYYAVNENYRHVSYAFSDFSDEVAHINHYYTKSYEEWLYKVAKGRVDFDQKRKEQEFWDYNPKMIHLKDTIREKFKNLTGNSATLIVKSVIQPNYSKWSPLFSGFEKQKVKSCLEQIKVTLSKYDAKPLGLFKGQSGISLYLFNLGKLTNNPACEDLANEILENIIINIRAVLADHSFANGLCGIGWLIEYLAQNQFIENNTNEILSDLDDLFKDSIFNLLDFSLTNGLLSYGMYFLSRLTNPENFNIEQKEMLVQLVNYLECFLPDNVQDGDEPENLTILQGYLAVIPFLCRIYTININRYKVLCVLDKYVKFILSFERPRNASLCFPNKTQDGTYSLQWNCGDLAVANTLLQAAKISKNKEWENKALEISLRTTLVKEIENPNTSIITGTAGIAHLYNRFYQHYHIPRLKEASVYWLNKTMEILENQKEKITERGLIDGLAGTGLVLMSVISETEPIWDSALLID